MLQQLDNPKFDSIELANLKRIRVDQIAQTEKNLKMQSKMVVDHMLDMMKLSSDGTLSWDQFLKQVSTLIPHNLEDKITLFLRACVPKTIFKEEEIDKYKFGKKEIVQIAESCLAPLFRVRDEFFTQLSENYAMIIYKIIQIPWD